MAKPLEIQHSSGVSETIAPRCGCILSELGLTINGNIIEGKLEGIVVSWFGAGVFGDMLGNEVPQGTNVFVKKKLPPKEYKCPQMVAVQIGDGKQSFQTQVHFDTGRYFERRGTKEATQTGKFYPKQPEASVPPRR